MKRLNYAMMVPHPIPEDILDLLSILHSRSRTGNKAIDTVLGFMYGREEMDLILNIIDKDLKIRCGVSLLNKALTEEHQIPTFKVALAEKMVTIPDLVIKVWYCPKT